MEYIAPMMHWLTTTVGASIGGKREATFVQATGIDTLILVYGFF